MGFRYFWPKAAWLWLMLCVCVCVRVCVWFFCVRFARHYDDVRYVECIQNLKVGGLGECYAAEAPPNREIGFGSVVRASGRGEAV